ncbi:MAG TPA: hypothetical protein VGA73_01080 [Candidatus Binatia bacterium]
MSSPVSHIHIPAEQRAELLKRALYKPRIYGVEGAEETGLLVRVEDLAPFHDPGLPLAIKPVAYQSEERTWVVCLILRVLRLPRGTLLAGAYLNPRQNTDYELLRRLASQQAFPVIFLSEDADELAPVPLAWSPVQREEISRLLGSIGDNLTGNRLGGGFDPDFESAVVELQENYTLEELME